MRKEKKSMNESTKTKKALRGSLLALFLCIVLLIGTTFAWFTDTASTGVNKIQACNLNVGIQYKTSNSEDWETVTENTDDIFAKDALWEPGHVEYV
ncbi:MAG: SipW-dependent-type signal peptide-containing protein, partial [Eubacteriales bacterium]|nr:SipW-dependent-type signal peptide-containing protein [Eubacteriales bacterium]